MRIFTETYSKDNGYIWKAESLPTLTPAAILEMEKWSWCTISLQDGVASLKSVLAVSNFCGLPVNQVCYRQCTNMETRLAISFREDQLGQHAEHFKPKTMDQFIRGRQITLEDFATLIANLCVACTHLMRLQLKLNHNHLTGWFVQQTTAVVILHEFRS